MVSCCSIESEVTRVCDEVDVVDGTVCGGAHTLC